MAALSSACYVRQQPAQPLKTLNVTNAILRTDKAPSSYRPQCTAKRKSAVELLQETKSLYVKSETVLDRKQELRRSLRSSGSSDKGSSSHDIGSGCYHYKGNCCNWSSGSITCLPPPKSPRLVAGCQRKSTADSQQLQNNLRRLLNADSKENLFEATSVFLDDVIVPPPIQYRRSAPRDRQHRHDHHEPEQELRRNDDSYLQQHHHATCTCGLSAACHKSLPDLTDVAAAAVASTTAAVMAAANSKRPARPRRCRPRSASSESVAAGDCDDDDGGNDDDDDHDDIFEMYRAVPSPHGYGNKSGGKPDETDGAVANNVICSFPDSLSLTSYKTDARWQQSAHGETGSSVGEENGGSVSPVKSTVSHGRGRGRRPQSGPTAACAGQQLLPPPPPPVAARRNHRNNNNVPAAAAAGGDEFRGRPILRSKSDVGHGAPNRPLSLLSAGPLINAAADVYYDPEQLEKFFGHLGLDPDEYRSIVKNDSDDGSQVCFGDTNSSVGSVSGGSNSGYVNGYNNNNTDGGPCAGGGRGVCGVPVACGPAKSGGNTSSSSEQQLPSIVERNARIIKWLWNCRKANLQQQQTPPTPWST